MDEETIEDEGIDLNQAYVRALEYLSKAFTVRDDSYNKRLENPGEFSDAHVERDFIFSFGNILEDYIYGMQENIEDFEENHFLAEQIALYYFYPGKWFIYIPAVLAVLSTGSLIFIVITRKKLMNKLKR